jgi:hypothetical protein
MPPPKNFSAVALRVVPVPSMNTGSISPLQLRCTQTSPISPGGHRIAFVVEHRQPVAGIGPRPMAPGLGGVTAAQLPTM